MAVRLYFCFGCNGYFKKEDVLAPCDLIPIGGCNYCSSEARFKANAAQNIIKRYNMRWGEYPEILLEIEVLRCKLNHVFAGKETKYITYKTGSMVTKVTNSQEIREALNENLEAILTGKRKLIVAKEVNNTLGKILNDVKMELMQNAITGNREQIGWFNNQKQLQNG